jgi:hypothetical protein
MTPPCLHTFDLSRLAERLAVCTRCGYVERAAFPARHPALPTSRPRKVHAKKGPPGPLEGQGASWFTLEEGIDNA